MKKILITLALVLTGSLAMAQTKTITIHTSAECAECEIRLEEELNYTKGVSFAELDVPSRDLTIKYNEKKISAEQLKEIIARLGYDADEVKADPKAQSELPECCQPGGMHQKKSVPKEMHEHPEGEKH